METLIWLLGTSVGAGVLPAVSRLLGYPCQRRTALTAVSSAAIAGLLVLLISPRCLCTSVNDMVLGTAVFGVMLGAAVSVLLSLGVHLWTRGRKVLAR